MFEDIEVDYGAIDQKINQEDSEKIEDTETPTSQEDGEQPPLPPLWNDDNGEVTFL